MPTIVVGKRAYDTKKLGPCPFCHATNKWTTVVSTIRSTCSTCGANISVDQNQVFCTNCGFGGS